MKENKLDTITNLFEGTEIRSIWDSEKEDYYFSVVDVISVLTESKEPRKYWSVLKTRLKKEGSELTTKCSQLKMLASDGKIRLRDVLDTEGIFRLIESVPSPKAEPFKMWLASLGKERIDEVFDPEKAKENGITKNYEYAILTNEIYKAWSGMKANEYKDFKGIRKESLRDNMSDIEVILTDLGEVTARDIAKKERPQGLKDNLKVAKRGGDVSKIAKESYEMQTGHSAITSENALDRRYVDMNKQLKEK